METKSRQKASGHLSSADVIATLRSMRKGYGDKVHEGYLAQMEDFDALLRQMAVLYLKARRRAEQAEETAREAREKMAAMERQIGEMQEKLRILSLSRDASEKKTAPPPKDS